MAWVYPTGNAGVVPTRCKAELPQGASNKNDTGRSPRELWVLWPRTLNQQKCWAPSGPQTFSESEEESESEEKDDITRVNEFLDQDLEELGPDRLDKEDIDESDVEIEVDEVVKSSKSFCQSIIDLEGRLSLPSEKVINMPILSKSFNILYHIIN